MSLTPKIVIIVLFACSEAVALALLGPRLIQRNQPQMIFVLIASSGTSVIGVALLLLLLL